MAVLFLKLQEEQLRTYVGLVRAAGKWISPSPGKKVTMQNGEVVVTETLYVVDGAAEFEYNNGEIRGKIGRGLEHIAVMVSGVREVSWTVELAGTKITNVRGSEAVNKVLLAGMPPSS